jgi:hypothetical protein
MIIGMQLVERGEYFWGEDATSCRENMNIEECAGGE